LLPNQFQRHYTVDEANALIPRVKEIFAAMAVLTRPAASGTNGHNGSNGNGSNGHHTKPGQSLVDELASMKPELREKALRALFASFDELGIVVQDVDRGLIDFPALLNGREVFLCYELSDGDSILYYHELDAGYIGRRPLENS
jgi:hypothetical protein